MAGSQCVRFICSGTHFHGRERLGMFATADLVDSTKLSSRGHACPEARLTRTVCPLNRLLVRAGVRCMLPHRSSPDARLSSDKPKAPRVKAHVSKSIANFSDSKLTTILRLTHLKRGVQADEMKRSGRWAQALKYSTNSLVSIDHLWTTSLSTCQLRHRRSGFDSRHGIPRSFDPAVEHSLLPVPDIYPVDFLIFTTKPLALNRNRAPFLHLFHSLVPSSSLEP